MRPANNPDEPLVSVVIPTYNRPKFLDGAIQTAIGQTHENVELVVVDDGSSQSYAEEVVAQYPDYVTAIRHDENAGLSAARNTGIRNSQGQFVAFLDDDDRWHETKLERQVAALEQNSEAGMATCLVAAISPDAELVHCESSAPSGDCSDSLLVSNRIGTPSRVLVRRACFDDIGVFDESLPTKQDWDFYLRLCQKWDIVAVADYLCFRTVHESMSSSPEAVERDKTAILRKHESLIRERGCWKQAQAEVAEETGRTYLETGSLRLARVHLRNSIRDFSARRLLLFLLSYTHPAFVDWVVDIKRRFVRRRSDCSDIDEILGEIPGLVT